jgi:hypothetical protein
VLVVCTWSSCTAQTDSTAVVCPQPWVLTCGCPQPVDTLLFVAGAPPCNAASTQQADQVCSAEATRRFTLAGYQLWPGLTSPAAATDRTMSVPCSLLLLHSDAA